MQAYKLFEIDRSGRLFSLFINKRDNPIATGVWLEAETHPTKGFAVRTGWHCCKDIDGAPHLTINPKAGRRRVWAVVTIDGVEAYDRPVSQGGVWFLAQRMRVDRIVTIANARFEIADCRGRPITTVVLPIDDQTDVDENADRVLRGRDVDYPGLFYRVKFIGWEDVADAA